MLRVDSTVACMGDDYRLWAQGWVADATLQSDPSAPRFDLLWVPLPQRSVQKALGMLAARTPDPFEVLSLAEPDSHGRGPGYLGSIVAMHIVRLCGGYSHEDGMITPGNTGRLEAVRRGDVWVPPKAQRTEVRTQTAMIGEKGGGFAPRLYPGNDVAPLPIVTMPLTALEWRDFRAKHAATDAVAAVPSPFGEVVHVLLHPNGNGKPLEYLHVVSLKGRHKR